MTSAALARSRVEYPESDGQPMAETPTHYACMVYITGGLRLHYRHRPDVYVGANMLHYYEAGNPHASVAPDVFVTFGAFSDEHRPGGVRRVYKVWEEPGAADFVLEVTSPSTRREDERRKHALYARLGVKEYFLHDPLGEYLRPGLKGYRLRGGVYEPMALGWGAGGFGIRSELLGLGLCLRNGVLRLYNPMTGQDLRTWEEEAMARQAAEARVAETEARIAELEQALRSRRGLRSDRDD